MIPFRHHQFYPLDPQIKAGRVVDADTIIWWMTQPDEARLHFLECASDDPEELPSLLKNLEMMFRNLTNNRLYEIYANSPNRSEEHTSELQSLLRLSYAVFCLKNKIEKTIK